MEFSSPPWYRRVGIDSVVAQRITSAGANRGSRGHDGRLGKRGVTIRRRRSSVSSRRPGTPGILDRPGYGAVSGRRIGDPDGRSVLRKGSPNSRSIGGMVLSRLQSDNSVTLPALERHPGTAGAALAGACRTAPCILAKLMPVNERRDWWFPMVLIIGASLRTGTLGPGRAAPEQGTLTSPFRRCECAPARSRRTRRVRRGELVGVVSRYGSSVRAYARLADGLHRGEVFMPFCYDEAASNLLTHDALDPCGKLPDFKFCAVRLEAVGAVAGSISGGVCGLPRRAAEGLRGSKRSA